MIIAIIGVLAISLVDSKDGAKAKGQYGGDYDGGYGEGGGGYGGERREYGGERRDYGGGGYERPHRRSYQVDGSICSLQAAYYLNGYHRQPQFCRSTGSNSQGDCLACCQIATRLRSGLAATDVQAFLAVLPGFANFAPPPPPPPPPQQYYPAGGYGSAGGYGGASGAAGYGGAQAGLAMPAAGGRKKRYDSASDSENDHQQSYNGQESAGGDSGTGAGVADVAPAPTPIAPAQCICCVPNKRRQRYTDEGYGYGGGSAGGGGGGYDNY